MENIETIETKEVDTETTPKTYTEEEVQALLQKRLTAE